MRLQTIAIAAAVVLGGLTVGAAAASDDHGRDGHHQRGPGEQGGGADRDHDRDHDHDGDRGHHRDRDGRHRAEQGRGEAGHRRGSSPADADPAYVKECGACHLAFPPSMLSAGAWRAMLGGLDRHFGQDAALDDATRARLEGYLVAQAGDGGGAEQRITRSAWFQRKHREVPAGVTSRPAVGSLANCGACHQDAARWDFDEHRVRIPR